MSPDARQQLEEKAERTLRRGNLAEGLQLYQQLAQAFPGDEKLSGKLAQIKETLQAGELTSAKSRVATEPPKAAGNSPVDQAEAHAARGEYAQAIALYRQVLAAKPGSELIKERLGELFQLAQAQAPRHSAPPPPKSAELKLSELLDKISNRRRT